MRHFFKLRRYAAKAALLSAAALLLAIPTARFASAGNTNSGFLVKIRIGLDCTVSATNLDFNTVGVLAAAVDAASSVTVTCGNGTPYQVGLDKGAGIGATTANRLMTGPGGATVRYSMYHNAARDNGWGDTLGSDTYSDTGTGSALTLPVYGRVFQQTTPAPGAYADNITVTVTY